ncbi:hypothetical protein [Amycolatopsis sp. NBC_01480]|uniref:hypothetical protein n=1 Tax=Amycolatopsis sp. NBC_01480 TaxID=2903562 RepID=UPI002E294245|nr:hypothetical protein [Amycolatopsis sp. NBC_01480]
MTYPPQPGQGGQPDPYGQGWQQQPPSGGVPQQPGWDPNAQQQPQQPQGWDPNAPQQPWDPNQQQPYGQPYQQGQQPYPTQQYPQQGWDPNQPPQGWDPNQQQYGQGFGGPGGPGGPPPQKNKTALWVGIAVAVVLVVALGITGFVAPGFFLSKDSNTNTAQNPPSQQRLPGTSAPGLPTDESSPPTDQSQSPGTGGSGDSGEGKSTVEAFLAKINAKDAAGASSMVCQGSESFSKDSITESTAGTPQLKAGEYSGSAIVTATISGSVSGKDANGSVIASSFDGKWCIGGFFVIAY